MCMHVILQHSDIAPGGWSSDGLRVELVDDQSITCSSTHLTSFAVLVDVSGGSQVVITYIAIYSHMSFKLSILRIYLMHRKLHCQL